MWDVNDTVLLDPGTDPDIGPYLRRVPQDVYLPTWYNQRREGQLGKHEQEAAWKAAAHAGTPGVAFDDPLGRTFLAVAHNRYRRNGEVVEEFQATRTDLDIQSNALAVTDALGRIAMSYKYDLTKRQVHQSSGDSGGRWSLPDIGNRPLRGLDTLDHRLRY